MLSQQQWRFPGEEIVINGQRYTIDTWLNAQQCERHQVYAATRADGLKAAVKFYPWSARAMPYAYQHTWTHLGRERDVSRQCVLEWSARQDDCPFLVKLLGRAQVWRGQRWQWCLATELVAGIPAEAYLKQKQYEEGALLRFAAGVADTLAQWHNGGVAHGDPHLGNVMVNGMGEAYQVTFIDYNNVHHPHFYYCQRFHCFTAYRPYEADLANDYGVFGEGFRTSLASLPVPLGLGQRLLEAFDDHYHAARR